MSAAAAAFPGIDRDVAVTGALLHDIGKTQAYNDDPLAIDLTDAGRLLGEIPLGYYLVRRTIETIEGFDPELAQAVLHIVLSHHGKLENGSPVVPATREATLVHAMDNLGGNARQLRPDRARAARRRGLVALRPRDRLGRVLPRPRSVGDQGRLAGPEASDAPVDRFWFAPASALMFTAFWMQFWSLPTLTVSTSVSAERVVDLRLDVPREVVEPVERLAEAVEGVVGRVEAGLTMKSTRQPGSPPW